MAVINGFASAIVGERYKFPLAPSLLEIQEVVGIII